MLKQRLLGRLAPAIMLLAATAQAITKPNIILITLDSTRADQMGFLGAKGKLTPSLDSLAQEGLVFEHAYAQAPTTVVSHATILTGTYPQATRVNEFGSPLPAALPYLPDLLHSRGYRTAAFVGSIELDPKNGSSPGFGRGFDFYDAGVRGPRAEEDSTVARSGVEVVARALAWLARSPTQPFFLWVELGDAQAPYHSSNDAGVRSADAAAGRLISALRGQKFYQNSLIVVTADHGESLGAHGEGTHGVFLYNETIRVPLLIRLPGAQMAGKRISTKVSLVSVAPTILEVAGAGAPPEMQGQSLLRTAKSNSGVEQPVYSRSEFPQQAFGWSRLESWRAGKYLYIRAPKPELYDLSADPGAAHNLAGSSRAVLDTIAGQLQAFDNHFGGPNSSASLTSSEMQKLASLGYVGLQKQETAATAATGTDPKDAIATANKLQAALLSLETGQTEQASRKAESIGPRQADLYLAQFIFGVVNFRKQQYAKASQYLHRAIELLPDATWAHYYMGATLLKTGDFKTAAVHLEIVCSRMPEFAAGHCGLSQAYEHLGRSSESQRERALAVKLGGS